MDAELQVSPRACRHNLVSAPHPFKNRPAAPRWYGTAPVRDAAVLVCDAPEKHRLVGTYLECEHHFMLHRGKLDQTLN